MPEKFWRENAPDFEGLATSYAKLEQTRGKVRDELEAERLGKRPAAIDAYVIPGEGEAKAFLENHPLTPVARELAFEMGLDQAGFEGLGTKLVEALQARAPKPEEEIQKLGENAPARIAALSHWVETNVSDESEKDQVAILTTTAAGVRFLERLVGKADGRLPDPPRGEPVARVAQAGGEFSYDGMTHGDVLKLMGEPSYHSPRHRDPQVHARVTAWFDAKERAGR